MKLKSSNFLFLSLVVVTLVISFSWNVWGAYLTNVPVKVTQPDGEELKLFASGDEYYNWLHDKEGYTIIKDPETGYYVYAIKKNGNLVPSDYLPDSDNPADANIPKNLKVSPEKRSKPKDLFPMPGSPAKPPSTGTVNNIAIFIRFSDETEFTDSISTYDNMFNNSGSGANSMRNYFLEASYNQLTISTTFYPTAVTTVVSYQDTNPRAYYQPYDEFTNPIGYADITERTDREHLLLKNAVDAVSSQIPPGLNIDGDNDWYVDNVCFIVKGSPDGWNSLLWPHKGVLYTQTAYIYGKVVYVYNFQLQTSLASSGVGVLCHEMYHSIGAPDLYHYSYDGLHPVANWGLMSFDSNPPRHMLAYMKYRYGGWIASIPQITTSGTYTLNPLTSSTGNCYKIASPYSAEEYFVVEYRAMTGTFENSLPGEGLLVYRINTTRHGNRYGPPDEVYIYRPDGTTTADGDYWSANFSSDVGRTAINDTTNPSSFLSDGSRGGLSLSNVGAVGSTISFDVGVLPPDIKVLFVQSDPNTGVTINVSPADYFGEGTGSTKFSRVYTDGTPVTLTAPPTDNGLSFLKWSLDGANYSFNNTMQVTMGANHTAVAHYGFALCEALDNCNLSWTTDGDAEWFGQITTTYYGGDAAQSGDISEYQSSDLHTSVTGPGTLKFYWKIGAESNFDFDVLPDTLTFYIDDVKQAQIEGYVDWQQKTYSIPPGSHTLKWRFHNEGWYIGETGWVDKVEYTPVYTAAKADFNQDGYSDIIWRCYDGIDGFNAVWLKGILVAGVSSKSSVKGSFTGINHPGVFDMENINAKDVLVIDMDLPLQELQGIKDGFAGTQTHGKQYNPGILSVPFDMKKNSSNQSLSQVTALTVADPRDDPQAVEFMAVEDQNWKIAGTADFNGDGKEDIVWSNVSTRKNCVWYMNGTEFAGFAWLPTGANADWILGGIVDFNNDGKPDLIWHNEADGRNGVWYLDGVTVLPGGYVVMTTGASLDWELCGTGDFNNDGQVDLVWRNKVDGRNGVWYMDGAIMSSVGWLDPVGNLDWDLRGTGDFNSDGKVDLIWRNGSNGNNCIWYLDGVTLDGVEFLTQVTDLAWTIEN
jgi:M6 family metalloprotease-like protein